MIITRNEGSELQATVRNLLATSSEDGRELIVVDDGSSDHSTEFLTDHPEIRVLRSDGVGVARARNLGAAKASGDVILFADAHVRAPENWLPILLKPFCDETVGAVAPGVSSLAEPQRRGFGLDVAGPNLKTSWRQYPGPNPVAVPVLPGCFLALRREAYLRSGGYDPEMRQLGGNDAELSCRLWLLGYRLLVVPQIEVAHLFRKTTPFQATWASVVHNRLRTAFVHFGRERLERVINAIRVYESFPAAMGMLLDSDVFRRRAEVAKLRKFDDDWFFAQFALSC